jgi:hypothetical protein
MTAAFVLRQRLEVLVEEVGVVGNCGKTGYGRGDRGNHHGKALRPIKTLFFIVEIFVKLNIKIDILFLAKAGEERLCEKFRFVGRNGGKRISA